MQSQYPESCDGESGVEDEDDDDDLQVRVMVSCGLWVVLLVHCGFFATG